MNILYRDIAENFYEENFKDKSVNTLYIINAYENVIVGLNPKYRGCIKCLKDRYISTRKDRVFLNLPNSNDNYKTYLLPGLDNIVKSLVYKMSEEPFQNELFQNRFFIVNKEALSISERYLTPVPNCDYCKSRGELNKDKDEKKYKSIISDLEKENFIPLRANNICKLSEKIKKIALDKDVGIINTLLVNEVSPFPIAVANLPLSNGVDEVGVGRTSNLEKSKAVALLEAMERYAGMYPKGSVDYNSLQKSEYIDVSQLILHEESLSVGTKYEQPYLKYNPDKKYHWIKGYNLTTKQPIFIPETYAYYGTKLKSSEYLSEQFVYEISNGCSVGSNLLEAIYYGILEVIERDAFLTNWYFKTPMREIIIDEAFFNEHKELSNLLKQFKSYYDEYDLKFFDISNDTNVPVVLAAVWRKNKAELKMNFMCAAAADFSIVVAIERSLHEISGILFGLSKTFTEKYDEITKLTSNLIDVQTMEQHSLVYGHINSLEKIDYIHRSLEKKQASSYWIEKNENRSITHELNIIINNLKRKSKDVIYVDQTTEEMNTINISCVKVIVPGLLPMTFGSKNVRVSKKRKMEMEKFYNKKFNINLEPHPFP